MQPAYLLPRTWEEGVLNPLPFLARRVREEVSISLPLSGRKGEEEGTPAFFCLMGEGAACRTQTPLMSCGREGAYNPSLFRGRIGDYIPEGVEDGAGKSRSRKRQDRKELEREVWMIGKFTAIYRRG